MVDYIRICMFLGQILTVYVQSTRLYLKGVLIYGRLFYRR